MHQLVTILVKKEGGEFHKEDAIETFCETYVGMEGQQPFDWAVVESAGRWKDEFPDNFLTGKDVIERLEKIAEFQEERQTELADQIKRMVGKGDLKNPENDNFMLWYLVGELSDRKLGRVCARCPEFIYLNYDSSNVSSDLIEEVKKNTDDYRILLVDAHF